MTLDLIPALRPEKRKRTHSGAYECVCALFSIIARGRAHFVGAASLPHVIRFGTKKKRG